MNTDAAHEDVQWDEPNRPIKVKEAAELVGVTPKTIRNWVDAGKIPGYRFGYNRMVVDLDDIEPLMSCQRITPKGGVR
ncbi:MULTISPECIES: helix-turn-helix domain-containing protein [Dietzia]|uniref:helix-turn-helix domain-containing protein n=1 Tax=Dietzia TaxID=37914 RepID=UPI0007847059|nr:MULTISPECIES: helix-turn-helix domain-containing protein [Dietzia]MCT2059580.1 helix-turn-helix domain-containing protein [Dietzia cinnamea]